MSAQIARHSHWILWLSFLFFLSFFTWAYYATVEEVTRGIGKVIPSSHVQVVQNLEGGIISELLVKAGDIVEKDQVILRIDDTRFASSFRESKLKSVDLQAKVARLTAEANGDKFNIPNPLIENKDKAALLEAYQRELALYQSRLQNLQANIDILQQQKNQKQLEIRELATKREQYQRSLDLARKELSITEPLVKKGVMAEVDLLRLQREAAELKGNLDVTQSMGPRAQAAVDEADRKIREIQLKFKTTALGELNAVKLELSQLGESSSAIQDQVQRTAVRSPVRGTVKQVKVTTVGGVVQPGMELVEIVPLEDSLLIEARIRPADIAFLHPQQNAMVKLTAYDFSIYGGLPAILEQISADSITDERGEVFFLIRLRTQKNALGTPEHPLPIMAGMTANVDILTGKKTILHYMLKPFLKAKERAFTER